MNIYRLKKMLPTALTIVGVAGVFVTAYFTHKGTKKAVSEMRNLPEEQKPKCFKEEVKKTWKHYIPAGVSGALTATAIISAQVLNAREIAAITATASYIAANKDKIEKKATEFIGEEKMNEIKRKIKPEYPHKGVSIEHTGKGDQLCLEGYSGRWFYSSPEAVDEAVNKFMEQIGETGYGCLNDLYHYLGITETHFGFQWGYVIAEGYYDVAPEWNTSFIDYEEEGKRVYCLEPDTSRGGWNYPMEGWMEI